MRGNTVERARNIHGREEAANYLPSPKERIKEREGRPDEEMNQLKGSFQGRSLKKKHSRGEKETSQQNKPEKKKGKKN